MNELQENTNETAYQRWSHTMAWMLAWQLNRFEAHCDAGFKIVEVALRIPVNSSAVAEEPCVAPRTSDRFSKLEALAVERARQGLAPPREVYDAQYRNQIDWFKFPEWARPTDPELYEDSGHEG